MLQTAEPRTLTHTTISKKMLHAPLCLEYCVTSKACSDLGPSLPKPTTGHCGMVQRLSSSATRRGPCCSHFIWSFEGLRSWDCRSSRETWTGSAL